MKCRHCNTNLTHTFVDLGSSPPSNSYLTHETIKKAEEFKQGHLNLVQYFLKKGCKFTVKDPESYATLLINTSDYESIKKAILRTRTRSRSRPS